LVNCIILSGMGRAASNTSASLLQEQSQFETVSGLSSHAVARYVGRVWVTVLWHSPLLHPRGLGDGYVDGLAPIRVRDGDPLMSYLSALGPNKQQSETKIMDFHSRSDCVLASAFRYVCLN
jgi:hypothetical protein